MFSASTELMQLRSCSSVGTVKPSASGMIAITTRLSGLMSSGSSWLIACTRIICVMASMSCFSVSIPGMGSLSQKARTYSRRRRCWGYCCASQQNAGTGAYFGVGAVEFTWVNRRVDAGSSRRAACTAGTMSPCLPVTSSIRASLVKPGSSCLWIRWHRQRGSRAWRRCR